LPHAEATLRANPLITAKPYSAVSCKDETTAGG
jgi:hypothetical protein